MRATRCKQGHGPPRRQSKASRATAKFAPLTRAEIEQIGLMEAINRKMFADISRQPDGGKGTTGVIVKAADYFNPFIDLMLGGASNGSATNSN